MGKVINIEELLLDLKLNNSCDLIKGIEQNFPPRCYGYPDECSYCGLPKYCKKAGIELIKLKLGV